MSVNHHQKLIRLVIAVLLGTRTLCAQSGADHDVVARARLLWDARQTTSAINLLKSAGASITGDHRADAQLLLGDIYFYKGWESEGAFPGWHEEPEYRAPAVAAYRAAAAARSTWSAPHERIGRALLREERPRDALAEFDAALERDPNDRAAQIGRWRAQAALGNRDAVRSAVERTAAAGTPDSLAAAREGYLLLDRTADADALASRIVDIAPASAAAASILAERIDAARAARRPPEAFDLARRYVAEFPNGPRLADAYDAMLDAYQAMPSASADEIVRVVEARSRLRSDPGPLVTGANLLVSRAAQLDTAISLAERSIPIADKFIDENRGSYKLEDKARASAARSRSAAIDTIGWAYFAKNAMRQAEMRLLEAERLSRGADAANQFHLGELMRQKGDLEAAREHYLNSLTLTGPPPLQAAAKRSLSDVYSRMGNDPAAFDTYVEGEITKRRDARQREAVTSMLDRPAPVFKVAEVTGKSMDLASLRGKVILLNFFASW